MMEEGNEKNEGTEKTIREEIFSRAIRAGKRTYFFDVKSTRRNDYYLTITESKKRFHRDGRFYFEKHKVFLYKEDFDKFTEGLRESIEFIQNSNPEILSDEIEKLEKDTETSQPVDEKVDKKASKKKDEKETDEVVDATAENYTSDVEFDDLEEKNE